MTTSISNTFLASTSGAWEGQQGFQYTGALYSFQANYLSLTLDQYKNAMTQIVAFIDFIGNVTLHNNLGFNLIILMARTIQVVDTETGNDQIISFTGAPASVFNRVNMFATFTRSPVSGDEHYASCGSQIEEIYFSQPSASYQIVYNAVNYTASGCNSIFNAPNFGVNFQTQNFILTMDMNSFTVAYAYNVGLLNFDNLEVVANSGGGLAYYIYDNVTYYYVQAFSDTFPDMDPIGCVVVSGATFPLFCVLQIGSGLLLPIFNHRGNSQTQPEYCDW